jgi:hydroxyacylglutathione hydrolase
MFRPVLLKADNPGPMTGAGNNTYLLVEHARGATLVDAGVGHQTHVAALQRHLTEEGARLERVIVTHVHADHASGVHALADEHPAARFEKYPWQERDAAYSVAWQALGDNQQIEAGGEPLTVIHTPGHSPDHIVLWHRDSATIFSGDLVVRGSSVAISWRAGGRIDEYIRSLRRVIALAPARLLPAHGGPITNPVEVLRNAIEHRRQREEQVAAALASGLDTVPSIAESIYDGLSPALMPVACETIRAHLEKLRSEGRVAEHDGRWWM